MSDASTEGKPRFIRASSAETKNSKEPSSQALNTKARSTDVWIFLRCHLGVKGTLSPTFSFFHGGKESEGLGCQTPPGCQDPPPLQCPVHVHVHPHPSCSLTSLPFQLSQKKDRAGASSSLLTLWNLSQESLPRLLYIQISQTH